MSSNFYRTVKNQSLCCCCPRRCRPGQLPPVNGSWAKPLEIDTVPYTGKTYINYVEDFSPVPCTYERNRVRVFR